MCERGAIAQAEASGLWPRGTHRDITRFAASSLPTTSSLNPTRLRTRRGGGGGNYVRTRFYCFLFGGRRTPSTKSPGTGVQEAEFRPGVRSDGAGLLVAAGPREAPQADGPEAARRDEEGRERHQGTK